MNARLAPDAAHWNTAPQPDVGAKESVAISSKITLEIRFADRPSIQRELGPGRMMLGRESGDIVLGDEETSALHAELEFTKGRVIVRDMGSRNGTWRDGQRLPQFALFPGQTFTVGRTVIALLQIDDEAAPKQGSTKSGQDKKPAQASRTVPRGSVAAVKDASAGPAAPTLPGDAPKGTMVAAGAVPPPGGPVVAPGSAPTEMAQGAAPGGSGSTAVGVPTPSTDTPSAPATPPGPAGMGSAPTLGAPASGADDASGPVAIPGTPPADDDASGPVMIPGAAPPTVAAPPPGPQGLRGPVANAVIKPGEVDLGPSRRKAKGKRGPRTKKILKWGAIGTLGAAAVAGIVFLIVTLVLGRNQVFFKKMAAELPQDTIGFIAFKSPQTVLDMFGGEVPEELVEQAKTGLGFDPWSADTYTDMGVDMDAPMSLSLLSSEGVVAMSVGVTDRDKLKEALSGKIATLLKGGDEDADLRWIERGFEDMPGYWLDEPIPIAVVFPEDRAIFITGPDTEDVARQAKRVAQVPDEESLVDRPGFQAIAKQRGKIVAAAYIDGASGRAALPGRGDEVLAMRMALADVDGLALQLIDDGPKMHAVFQMMMRDGAETVSLFEGDPRDGAALAQIPTPVLAAMDARVDPGPMYRTLTQTALGLGLDKLESEFKEETGLDLRADLLENITGEFGLAMLELPGEDDKDNEFSAVAWLGVKDEGDAKRAAERFFSKNQGDFELEQVEGTTLYVAEDFFRIAFFVHSDHVFLALGKADAAKIIEGPSKSIATDTRHESIAEAVEKGGLAAGFFDVRQFLFALRPQLSESERETEKTLGPLLSPIETVTLRGEVKKRTIIAKLTVHTTWDDAMPSFVQAATEIVGKQIAEEIARKRRADKCSELIDHILGLMRTELGEDTVADLEYETRATMLDECLGDETSLREIECMLRAGTLDGLTACEAGQEPEADDGGTPAAGEGGNEDEPDPVPVPYVGDIWPNASPTGAGNGKPDPAVNYAVGLGDDPQARGAESALVTIVMFGDFQCPYCKRVLGTVDQVMAKYGKDVRLVFRHNPLAMHAEAKIAARAAIAAGRQGKFWGMHDKLYDNQHALTEDNFRNWADELGLDVTKFDRDYADRFSATQVDTDMEEAAKFGARVTPSFFVNGRYLAGAQPLHAFETVIDEEMERVKKFVERRGNTRKGLYADMSSRFAAEVTKPPKTPIATPSGGRRYTLETATLPRKGTTGIARVELVECGDFDCPFCKRATDVVDKLVDHYDRDLAVFFVHNPLSFHTTAEPAARAAVAAENQGKFWEMHDKLFDDKTRRTDSDFLDMARDLGLDVPQFEIDLNSEATKDRIKEQQKTCVDNDATGTPTFFINGRLVSGARNFDEFKDVIDEELAGGI